MKTQQIEQNTIMQFIFLLITIFVMTAACTKDELIDPIEDDPIVESSSNKVIKSFVFLQSTNFTLPYDVVGKINETEKTITLEYPNASLPTRLSPKVETSVNSIYGPALAQDFTNPVEYTITAEDGSSVKYTVTVNVENTEREVLQAILDANPSSRLDWDLSGTVNLGDLDGVELNVHGKIDKLYLHKNLLTNVPVEIGKLKYLEVLYLSTNSLTSVPVEIGNLVSLRNLHLNGNRISNLPVEIGNLVNLETLALGYNSISIIPAEIGHLIKLVELDLCDNSISRIPSELGFLHKLLTLKVSDNNLSDLPSSIFNLVKINNLNLFGADGLESRTTEKDVLIVMDLGNDLNWSVSKYEGVSFDRNGKVTKIVGQKKNIKLIPEEIGILSNLRVLNLDQNSIKSLPPSLGEISGLEIIGLSSNQIQTLPSELGKLKNAVLMNLTNNPIGSIPNAVCNLQVSNGGKLTILADPGEGCD